MAKSDSPIGSSVEAHSEQRSARSHTFRETQERLRPFEEFARVVIEGGRHRSGTDTLRRLAQVLDGHALIGFEFGSHANVVPSQPAYQGNDGPRRRFRRTSRGVGGSLRRSDH